MATSTNEGKLNHPTADISFDFQYDGTSATVSVDTRNGPTKYNMGSESLCFHPEFSAPATGVAQVSISVQGGIGGQQQGTTAVMHSGVLVVTIPSGFTAGTLNVTATLLF